MADPRCPVTGETMVRDTRPMTITYKGHSTTFDMPGWYCDTSGESVHNGADMKVSDRALNALKADVEGVIRPQEVKRIRTRLKLTQKEAGLLIGGGPNAFQKYERGDILTSHAVTSALLLLERDPAGLEILKKHRNMTQKNAMRKQPKSRRGAHSTDRA